jgi:hypothetical protein
MAPNYLALYVRGLNPWEIYEFYNVAVPKPLPPPKNPTLFQLFFFVMEECIAEIEQGAVPRSQKYAGEFAPPS